jgi:RNA polymerase sigma-32 factor
MAKKAEKKSAAKPSKPVKKTASKKTAVKAAKPALKKAKPVESTSDTLEKSQKKIKKVVAEVVDKTHTPKFKDEHEHHDDNGHEAAPSKANLPVAAPEKGITARDPLSIYLNEVRRYPVLSREDELKLAQKFYETKDPEAAQMLVKSNLRFVIKIAAEYSKFGAKMIDLIQEGNVGLMHAVREFNPYKGTRLITYAVWWIRGYIQEYLMRQYSLVRIGTTQNQRKLFYQLQKEKEALDALGKNPDLHLLSERLGIPEDEITDMAQRLSGRDVSLDRPVDEDSPTSLKDLQKDNSADESLDDKLAREEQLSILKEKIEEIRPELSDREKIILDERILNDEPLTLQEIGEKYGITREAVRQMEARLMKKIKTKMAP